MDTHRKVVIVTGAGSGVGRATAVLLGRAGYAVVLAGRTASKLDDTAAMIESTEGDSSTIAIDLCDSNSADAVVKHAVQTFGRVDVLANVAGYASLGSLEETSDAEWTRNLGINLNVPFYLTRAVWPHFRDRRGGFIVNVSSMAAKDPFPGFGAYGTAKAGLNLLTLVTAREGSEIGVNAICVAPGAVETPMLRSLFDETIVPKDATMSPESLGARIVEYVEGRRPFESGETVYVLPDDVAE